jgi:hypothetical protein
MTWELDTDTEEIDGVTLASLHFTAAFGQVTLDHFTPDALRGMADELIDQAESMDGRSAYRIADLQELLQRCYRYLGCYPYEVPDGLKGEVKLAARINRDDAISEVDA